MTAYYNESDPYAAQWLRNLIEAGHIAPGIVDERSITAVRAAELAGFDQCHFFAGIGVWSYSLRLAGWPDDRPVWTGSCPCQPFSSAGKRAGHEDERHLWPAWARLIRERRPVACFGEQVASADGYAWLDLVLADLEACGYAVGAVDFPAAGAGAPHIRQRLWFFGALADADADRQHSRSAGDVQGEEGARREDGDEPARCGCAGLLADAERARLEARAEEDLFGARRHGQGRQPGESGERRMRELLEFWSDVQWLACRDGKYRPIEPGTFPLAHGAAARVGRLRAYGNALQAQAAAAFITAAMSEA